jgi:NAD(P)H dehydrogenase (quinone)
VVGASMPPLPPLAVTGATGGVGGMVARELAAAGLPQRLLVRDLQRAPGLDGAASVFCSYADTAACAAALAGAQTVLMVSASEAVDRLDQHRSFVDAARQAGVGHLVYTSFYGASAASTFTLGRDHYATEEYIKEAGLDYTFLRDNFYLDFLPAMVGEDDVIRGPAGQGRVAGVTRADVAAVAAKVLRDPAEHRGRTYDLTGPQALTLTEVAVILSEGLGREIRFHDESIKEAYASRARWHAPDWQLDAWVSTYTSIAAGEVAEVTGDVEALLGRPPQSLSDFLSAAAP